MRVLFYIVLMGVLTSCSTINKVIHDDNQYQFSEYTMPGYGKSKQYRFISGSSSGIELEGLVLNELRNSVKRALPELPAVRINRGGVNKLIDAVAKKTGSSIVERASARVDINRGFIEVSFIAGQYINNRKGEAIQRAKYPFVIEHDKNYLLIIISPPKKFISRSGNIGNMGEVLPLFDIDDAKIVFANIFREMEIRKISYEEKRSYAQSTIVSRYPVDSIFSNIKTKKGYFKFSLKDEVGRGAIYEFSVSGIDVSLRIKIYPYRNGSKVIYDTIMHQPVTLYADGTSSANKYPPQEEIKRYMDSLINE